MYALRVVRNICFSRLLKRSISGRAVVDNAGQDGELRVFIVSGEVSGDTIGARLIASLSKISPLPIRLAGVGGSMMSQQGLKSLFPMEDIAVMGILELLPHLNRIRRKLEETVDAALQFRPHVVVTVDSKGFSFRFLKQLRARCSQQSLGSPAHFHYVAPSFWAWKGGEARLKGLSHFVDHIFCILPFEEEVCKSNGLAATFVGHPVLEDILELNLGSNTDDWKVEGNSSDFRKEFEVPPVTLLPGSRLQEVTRMLPIFSKTVELLKGSVPQMRTVIHVAPNQCVEEYICRRVQQWPVPVTLIPGSLVPLKYDAFSASKAALCTSGTVAVELQLARLPCLVAYRAHILTEWFVRCKAKVPYMSIPNILLNSRVIPEALFEACNPTRLASLLMELIHDEGLREQQISSAEKVMKLLSPPPNDFVQHDLGWTSTPSMIAASTLLYYRKPC
ncbi:hypothetical protein Ancab_008089 [Ancistrocladus abbreviatus]